MRPIQTLLTMILAFATAGCAAVRLADDDDAAAPADLTVDVAVLIGEDVPDRPEAHLRQSRFVVFPDGTLHFAADEGLDANDLPGVTRALDAVHMARLWSMLRELGFAERDSSITIENPQTIEAAADEIVYVVSIVADDNRWMQVQRFRSGDVPPGDTMKFIRQLARLAWATDEPQRGVAVAPKRYDFGPDPYARYRETQGGP